MNTSPQQEPSHILIRVLHGVPASLARPLPSPFCRPASLVTHLLAPIMAPPKCRLRPQVSIDFQLGSPGHRTQSFKFQIPMEEIQTDPAWLSCDLISCC